MNYPVLKSNALHFALLNTVGRRTRTSGLAPNTEQLGQEFVGLLGMHRGSPLVSLPGLHGIAFNINIIFPLPKAAFVDCSRREGHKIP